MTSLGSRTRLPGTHTLGAFCEPYPQPSSGRRGSHRDTGGTKSPRPGARCHARFSTRDRGAGKGLGVQRPPCPPARFGHKRGRGAPPSPYFTSHPPAPVPSNPADRGLISPTCGRPPTPAAPPARLGPCMELPRTPPSPPTPLPASPTPLSSAPRCGKRGVQGSGAVPSRAPPPHKRGPFVPEATRKTGGGYWEGGGREKAKTTINIDKQRDSLQPSH